MWYEKKLNHCTIAAWYGIINDNVTWDRRNEVSIHWSSRLISKRNFNGSSIDWKIFFISHLADVNNFSFCLKTSGNVISRSARKRRQAEIHFLKSKIIAFNWSSKRLCDFDSHSSQVFIFHEADYKRNCSNNNHSDTSINVSGDIDHFLDLTVSRNSKASPIWKLYKCSDWISLRFKYWTFSQFLSHSCSVVKRKTTFVSNFLSF